MKRSIWILTCSALLLGGLSARSLGDLNPCTWTGASTICDQATPDNEWSDVANWTECGSQAPGTDDDVAIQASSLCDPCDDGICVGEWCGDPPCPTYCSGGPHNGESCTTNEDCETDCAGMYTIVSYDCSADTTYGDVSITANADYGMELQKDSTAEMVVDGNLSLTGYSSSKKAVLDVPTDDLSARNVYACGDVDITISTGRIVTVINLLNVGCAGRDTTTTLTGGTLDVDGQNQTVRVQGYSSATTDFEMDGDRLELDYLEVLGGGDANGRATFHHKANRVVYGLDDVLMRGDSVIDVDALVDYSLDELKVESVSTGSDTDAKIYMDSSKTLTATACNVVVTGDHSYDAKLTPKSGTLSCGTLTLTGNDGTYSADAELVIPETGGSVSLTNVTLNERGYLTANVNATITGELTLAADSTTGAELWIRDNKSLTVDQLVVKAGVTYTPDFGTSADLRTQN